MRSGSVSPEPLGAAANVAAPSTHLESDGERMTALARDAAEYTVAIGTDDHWSPGRHRLRIPARYRNRT